MMNNGFIVCGISCLLFLIFAFVFMVFKGKATLLISGFNMMPKEKRALYDKDEMSKDYRNIFLIWTAIQGAGAVLSYCISQYMAVVTFAICLIILLKNMHLDEEKAFGKYRK